MAAYTPFTPSNSGQRLPPTYYRGCWHVVSRGFLLGYRHFFVPKNRALRPEGLLRSRGVAASGFPPLRNIPHCCLPQESGPCLSPSVADHPLRSATHRCLGEPLPHQPANGTRARPVPLNALTRWICILQVSCGISTDFPVLFLCTGLVAHALLTRPPLGSFSFNSKISA